LNIFSGEKHIVKLLHFPNITPSEQRRILMSDSSSASDDEEQEPRDGVQKTQQRKKSSTKRSLDLQRKISLNKLKEERKEQSQHNNVLTKTPDSSSSPTIELPPLSLKHGKRLTRNGKISAGYEQFSMSLLTVPMPKDYGEPSSDDLSSEWDSDVPDNTKTNGTPNKESKVRVL
jgi:carboxylesterase type B